MEAHLHYHLHYIPLGIGQKKSNTADALRHETALMAPVAILFLLIRLPEIYNDISINSWILITD